MRVKVKMELTLKKFLQTFPNKHFLLYYFEIHYFWKIYCFALSERFELSIVRLKYVSRTKTFAPSAKMSFSGFRWNLREQKTLPWVIHPRMSSSVIPVSTQSPSEQRSMITWTHPPDLAGAQKSRRTQWFSSVIAEFRMSV